MSSALIVIDMLNTYDHEDAEPLMGSVRQVIKPLARLIDQARESDTLTVYVNDNYGDWGAGAKKLSEQAMRGAAPDLVEPIVPPEGIPFVVKARHSIFYQTQLEYLLRENEIERVILTGQVTEQCILYSALDAYVRHFDVVVPRDAVAHIDEQLSGAALRMMESNMHAQIASSDDALEAAVSS